MPSLAPGSSKPYQATRLRNSNTHEDRPHTVPTANLTRFRGMKLVDEKTPLAFLNSYMFGSFGSLESC